MHWMAFIRWIESWAFCSIKKLLLSFHDGIKQCHISLAVRVTNRATEGTAIKGGWEGMNWWVSELIRSLWGKYEFPIHQNQNKTLQIKSSVAKLLFEEPLLLPLQLLTHTRIERKRDGFCCYGMPVVTGLVCSRHISHANNTRFHFNISDCAPALSIFI